MPHQACRRIFFWTDSVQKFESEIAPLTDDDEVSAPRGPRRSRSASSETDVACGCAAGRSPSWSFAGDGPGHWHGARFRQVRWRHRSALKPKPRRRAVPTPQRALEHRRPPTRARSCGATACPSPPAQFLENRRDPRSARLGPPAHLVACGIEHHDLQRHAAHRVGRARETRVVGADGHLDVVEQPLGELHS